VTKTTEEDEMCQLTVAVCPGITYARSLCRQHALIWLK